MEIKIDFYSHWMTFTFDWQTIRHSKIKIFDYDNFLIQKITTKINCCTFLTKEMFVDKIYLKIKHDYWEG